MGCHVSGREVISQLCLRVDQEGAIGSLVRGTIIQLHPAKHSIQYPVSEHRQPMALPVAPNQ